LDKSDWLGELCESSVLFLPVLLWQDQPPGQVLYKLDWP
jgi:hypothetical protein